MSELRLRWSECNIKTKDYKLDESTDQETLLKLIKMLNEDTDIHGILVQLPLPKQIDEEASSTPLP